MFKEISIMKAQQLVMKAADFVTKVYFPSWAGEKFGLGNQAQQKKMVKKEKLSTKEDPLEDTHIKWDNFFIYQTHLILENAAK